MNSLAQTVIFNQLANIPPFKTIAKINFEDYVISDKFYKHKISSFNEFRSPMMKSVIKLMELDQLVPIMLEMPEKKTINAVKITPALFVFAKKLTNKSAKIYVNISSRATYIENKESSLKEIQALKINNTDFYYMMQSGLIAKIMVDKPNYLTGSPNFIKNTAETYSSLLSRCIDVINPISFDKDEIDS